MPEFQCLLRRWLKVRHLHGCCAGSHRSKRCGLAVFKSGAVMCIETCCCSGFKINFWLGFAKAHLIAAHHMGDQIIDTCLLQMMQRMLRTGGCGHHTGNAGTLQQAEQFVGAKSMECFLSVAVRPDHLRPR